MAEEQTYSVKQILEKCYSNYDRAMLRKYLKELGIPEEGTLTDSQIDWFYTEYMLDESRP